MDSCHCNANKSVECSVVSCKNHCGSQNFCSLDQIRIGSHERHPGQDACTDCLSFQKK